MRALVISNMRPDAAHPERGRFVRDQVAALRKLQGASVDLDGSGVEPDGWSVDLYEFPPGARALAAAALDLRRRYRGERFDVVHAHFGLSAWPALAVKARGRALTLHGTDVTHPRTRIATRAVLPTVGLLAAASQALIERIPGRWARERAKVLPCGVDMERFRPIPRAQARSELGLDAKRPYALFAADPARAEKRYNRASALAQAVGVDLLTLGGVDPERVPLYVNAASVVLIPSEREGFGLAALEALACDVPVLATPVGVHPKALDGIDGCLCAPFELKRWQAALQAHLAEPDPRVDGRVSAEPFSAERMAERVAQAWRSLVADDG